MNPVFNGCLRGGTRLFWQMQPDMKKTGNIPVQE